MDYEGIIKNLKTESVIQLMKQLGADRYIEKENFIIFPTICHNINSEDASMKLYFYKDTKLFVCYTECGNMSIFNLLKHYYETRQIEYDWYQDIYQVILNCSTFKKREGFMIESYQSLKDRYKVRRKEKRLPEFSKNVLDCFIKTYPPEWLSDNISKEAMDKFDIRYSISQNKIIIPHYDIDNRLIGIRGRALTEWEIENVGKYAPVKIEDTWYAHPLSMNVYGLNFNKDNIKKAGICFLVESEKSVMQMESFSFPNCSGAVCGSNFNKYQLNIIMKYCNPDEIVICFDNEELPGEEKYFYKLYNICKKYSSYCNFSFIYDRKKITKQKNSPTDDGEKIFIELLKRRVKVL